MSESLHTDAGQRSYRILRDPELGLGPGPVVLPREEGEPARSSAARLAALADVLTAQSDGVDAHTEVLVRQQVVPISASGRRESRRLALHWWVLLAVIAGAIALGWKLLLRR